MLNAIQSILASQSPWSASFYLVLGAFVGSYLTFRAQRPKLVIDGSGGGGGGGRNQWSLQVSNRPSFLGLPFTGEVARDVHAWLTVKDKGARSYLLFWAQQQPGATGAVLEPGDNRTLNAFVWNAGTRGYAIVDEAGDPIARFTDRELRFVVTLNDKLGRRTSIPILVKFDDSHLKNDPQMSIITPISLSFRLGMIRRGLNSFRTAFSLRRR